MQYMINKSGDKIPFYNVRRVDDSDNNPISLHIQFRMSELTFSKETLESWLKNNIAISELKAVNDVGVWLNSYYDYSKLDSLECRYNVLITPYQPEMPAQEEQLDEDGKVIVPAITGQEEVPEVRDDVITAILLKVSDVERRLTDTTTTVDAIAVAMAEIMGV